jgi:hypothetical protein
MLRSALPQLQAEQKANDVIDQSDARIEDDGTSHARCSPFVRDYRPSVVQRCAALLGKRLS